MEHVWKMLKDAVSSINPPVRNIEDMCKALDNEWNKLDKKKICKVVENMPQRIKDVIQAKVEVLDTNCTYFIFYTNVNIYFRSFLDELKNIKK
jgi:hypothetical protein